MKKNLHLVLFIGMLSASKLSAQAPFITYFTPTIGTTGDTIEINGFSFDSTTQVHFGDSLAASFTVVSNNRIKAVVGFCTQGFVDVKVTTVYGVNTRPGFEFVPTPYITSFTPTSAGLDDVVFITGVNLGPFNSVTFGGVPGTVIQQSATSAYLYAKVGPGASGDVRLFNSFGGHSKPGFTFQPQVIANFTFSSANGSYFAPANIQFIDMSTSTAPITSWHWDFGDGATSTLQNPQHVYTFPGVYAVRLAAQSPGKADTVMRMIQIGMLQEVDLCPGDSSILVSTDTSSNIQWQVSTDSLNFVDMSDGIHYGGTNDDTLTLYSLPSSFYGNLYRCMANGQVKFETWVVKFSNTWMGTVSNAWENPANWSCGSIPDSGTDVIINSGTVVLNTNTTIRSLKLAPGASLTVASGVVLTILH